MPFRKNNLYNNENKTETIIKKVEWNNSKDDKVTYRVDLWKKYFYFSLVSASNKVIPIDVAIYIEDIDSDVGGGQKLLLILVVILSSVSLFLIMCVVICSCCRRKKESTRLRQMNLRRRRSSSASPVNLTNLSQSEPPGQIAIQPDDADINKLLKIDYDRFFKPFD